ncbi:MAG: Gfo/Idh/MocA family oxidoreductase [Clostridiales bacterium]|nr:Gfo/Idh/MocA family oxidoreductase [Clostridiales bacterium]
MNQLTQKLKSGEMTIQELPWPQAATGMVVVRNHYSLISAGTEGSTVKTARASLIGKARERPQQVAQVLDVLIKQGPVQTYRAVMKKLDAYSPLGYSSAGEVIEVGPGVTSFAVGDRVACAGVGYANHAEIISVPVNLCVKLPEGADLKRAAYNTLGAIALQGVRQADLRLGESCGVIGLGLLGQLTCLMLRASGVRVFGIDVDEWAVKTAAEHCTEAAWVRSNPAIETMIENATGGLGVDGVIITAGTSSPDPINFAGAIARKKGTVVMVGNAPTGFDRDPHWYRKELQLRMSCSYGPGRYDPAYEEKGLDYPAAYVRWTEKRNMEAFQDLLHSGRMDIDYLTTHQVPLEEAPKAYDMILNRTEPFLGIVIRYDVSKPIERKAIRINDGLAAGKVGLAFIGAGSYAQGNLLPNISDDPAISRIGVLCQSGTSSRRVAERFGFEICTDREEDILDNAKVNTVFIATRHDTHARYVLSSIQKGKNVFVEKPLCLTPAELDEIEGAFDKKHLEGKATALAVGFNRRFSPLSIALKKRLGEAPVSMLYRVNAGSIPADHWIQDPEIGGGRIVGEACHFIDLLTFFAGSLPKRVYASSLPDARGLNDIAAINLEFTNGSVGTVMYYSNGPKSMPKEYLEVYQAGQAGIIEDFKKLTIQGEKKPLTKRLVTQDKGQKEMVRKFLESIKSGGAPLIPPDEVFAVTRTTFSVLESMKSRHAVTLS